MESQQSKSASEATTGEGATAIQTTVEVRPTGNVRAVVGEPRLEFTFEGSTLRAFLDAFFAEYDVRDLLMAETDEEATTSGWAPAPEELTGNWTKNPEGEGTRRYARVTVNGRFNEHLDGLDTELSNGDRIGLIQPFMFCL